MKPIRIYETTLKDVLLDNPQGSYIYRIMFNDDIPFYVGITLKGVKDRFKTHIAKFAGIKKYNDRPKCQEMVFESKELKFYRDKLDEYTKEYLEDIQKNQKSDKEKKNWSSLSELKKVMNGYKRDIQERGILKKEKLSTREFYLLQNYLITQKKLE